MGCQVNAGLLDLLDRFIRAYNFVPMFMGNIGTGAQRPKFPVAGELWYDNNVSDTILYDGKSWVHISM